MSLQPVEMPEVLRRLQVRYPNVLLAGDSMAEGYWIRAVSSDGDWAWERFRLASPSAAQYFAEVALTEFAGAH